MEQRVLVIKIGRGRIVSKPWDFEAMCRVDDCLERGGLAERAADAVAYLFEGTKATEEFLSNLPQKEQLRLCAAVWGWFMQDLSDFSQPGGGAGQTGEKKPLRDVYRAMFQAWGRLPGEIGCQRPADMLRILCAEEQKIEDLPPEARLFYGM